MGVSCVVETFPDAAVFGGVALIDTGSFNGPFGLGGTVTVGFDELRFFRQSVQNRRSRIEGELFECVMFPALNHWRQ